MTRDTGFWLTAMLLVWACGAGCANDADDADGQNPDVAALDAAPRDGGSPDSSTPASECPASPSDSLEISARPFNPADDSYHPLGDGVFEFEGTVIAVEAGSVTIEPADEPWMVSLSHPPGATPGFVVGEVVSVDLGLRMPFWQEAAYVVRRADGLTLAAVSGGLEWLGEPMFNGDGLSVAIDGRCARREAECQSVIDQVLVFSGGGDSLRLAGGAAGVVPVGGVSHDVSLSAAWTSAGGDVSCTDQPGSWVEFVITPSGP